MERLKEAPVVVGLPSTPGKAGAKHRKRVPPNPHRSSSSTWTAAPDSVGVL